MADDFKPARLCQGARLYDEAYNGDNAPDWAVKYMEFLYEYHHRPRHIFPFMLLPAELREKIYRFSLTRHGPMHVQAKKTMERRVYLPEGRIEWVFYEPPQYPLLRQRNLELRAAEIKFYNNARLATACLYMDRETSAEAAHVLYSETVFRFDDKYVLNEFLVRLPAKLISRIRSIQFLVSFDRRSGAGTEMATAFRSLAPLTNLRRVELRDTGINCGDLDHKLTLEGLAASVILQPDCLQWLKAIGRAKGDARAGADVFRIAENVLRVYAPFQYHHEEPADVVGNFKAILGNLLECSESTTPWKETR
ncbi:hypothetical protein SLS58_009354 [Diplodia intermedia]|uniref:DUF7730 domain-containing protein n=1 Tax=Diplodia intermedia TaxID=856260 RepID=A0ABR3TCU4_9PEZI